MPAALTVTIEGLPELQAFFDRITPGRGASFVHKALVACALTVQADAATNRIQRSAPTGAPANPPPGPLISRTGTLRRSIRVDRSGIPRYVDVGSDLVYAAVHELGGRHTQPRPFLAPALQATAGRFQAIFEAEWAREIAAAKA